MPHGILLIDKPAGLSSAQALRPLKQLVGRAKVGHAGTLDPFATGLLLALVGDGTRLSNLARGLSKTYVANVAFGRATDTLDPEGRVVVEEGPGAEPPASLREVVARFRGAQEQVPPRFSALKVDGRRAYRLARAGEEPRLDPRRVVVHEIEVTGVRWPEVDVRLACGSGFYVRSFARDLGAALDIPAHLRALRRTHIGPFAAADGCAPEDVRLDRLLDLGVLADAAGLPAAPVDERAALRFAEGRAIDAPGPDGVVCVRTDDLLVGWGTRTGELQIQPDVVLSAARRRLESGA